MENYLKLEPIYAELNRVTNEKAEELIKELKITCNTYKDLYSKLDLFDKQIRFTRDSNKFVNAALIAESKRLLDKEVNDLPLSKAFVENSNEIVNNKSSIDREVKKALSVASEKGILIEIDPESYLGIEIMKQSKSIINQNSEVRDLKREIKELKKIMVEKISNRNL
ncbi:hypothetical protein [Clostridium intestinale]|uniref:Uncharacterized protein n=1 Tax=Clostridium intestinale DSM 6191 TaxID=1121320 RepID=A0A1M5U3X2_9CLOT|nr:hypothetical protein [Clostridium intestinale]SHH57551.1 hypothetical protein SAMN02745941_00397 [Clostridium intestinale DSM 6191]